MSFGATERFRVELDEPVRVQLRHGVRHAEVERQRLDLFQVHQRLSTRLVTHERRSSLRACSSAMLSSARAISW
jgi:hypothetical protein